MMGEDTATLVTALACDHGIRHIRARHENAAVAMAGGYARVTGEPGVAIISRGPGLTNALTAITAAQRAGLPVVVVTGDEPTFDQPHVKSLRHAPVLDAVGVRSLRVETVSAIGRAVDDAFASAQSGTPTVINVATDTLDGEVGVVLDGDAPELHASQIPVDRDAIARVAQKLKTSRRPMIIAGRGAVLAEAQDSLRELARRSGALLGTTLLAKGLFADDPFDLGVIGHFSTPVAEELVDEVDAVVAFGASLSRRSTSDGTQFADIYVARVDNGAGGALSPPTVDVDEEIGGDAREVAEAMLQHLSPDGRSGLRGMALAERLAAVDWKRLVPDNSSDDGIDPHHLMLELDSVLPADRTLVVDAGAFAGFALKYLTFDPRAFFAQIEFGTMGVGLGAAIGATVAARHTVTVLVAGDAGFLMSLSDIETAVRYRLPLVVVIVNDRALGAERHYLESLGMPYDEALISTPSFEELARGLGADGYTIRGHADLAGLAEPLAHLDGPLLIDCQVNPAVKGHWSVSVGRPGGAL